jgi:hypothetical protein
MVQALLAHSTTSTRGVWSAIIATPAHPFANNLDTIAEIDALVAGYWLHRQGRI